MRILLIEDDPMLSAAVSRGLEQGGLVVDVAASVAQSGQLMAASAFDCILLDLGLPDMDGADHLRHLRRSGWHKPIIVTTARASVRERVELLNAGADDYLVKPMDLDELAARIHAATRRSDASPIIDVTINFGPLQLNPATRAATWYGRPVELNKREFGLLEVMLKKHNRQRVMSRPELEQALYSWGTDIASNAVEVHIHHIRRKLRDDLILTVRGQGYRLGPDE